MISRPRLLLAAFMLSAAVPAQAQAPVDLSAATLEDLMNIEITSASRKEQRAEDVAAAVYVITRDDIRRSGMTSVPDLLRLVPGVQVAQINSNKWAISVRGFNGLYSNKLLVLVDGRSVYNPLFSGVLWDTQDLMLEDVDRIEVIRGPGAAVWGANAVNGVINIITQPANETGGLLYAPTPARSTSVAPRSGTAPRPEAAPIVSTRSSPPTATPSSRRMLTPTTTGTASPAGSAAIGPADRTRSCSRAICRSGKSGRCG